MQVRWIGPWWRQPDHYRWLSAYLASRNLQRFTRYMMGVIVTALGTVPVLMLWSPSGPSNLVERGLSLAVATCCLAMATLWFVRWPTRAQSKVFAVVASLCIGVTCVVSASGSGLQGCTAFAALAGYVAFFHTTRMLVITLSIAAITAFTCASVIVADGDPLQAASKLIVLFVSVLAVPFSAQVLVYFLGVDAINSGTDSLTGLPNRRSFHRLTRALATDSSRDSTASLSIVMVDLDDFKRVNDTAGHAAGDRTLAAVGDIIRCNRYGQSVAARIGGEEFVVAVSGNPHDAIGLAERLRSEIAQAPFRVTASVGVASESLFRVVVHDIPAHVDRLVESADRAMYRAKRAGGNRVHAIDHPPADYDEKPIPSSTTATKGNAP